MGSYAGLTSRRHKPAKAQQLSAYYAGRFLNFRKVQACPVNDRLVPRFLVLKVIGFPLLQIYRSGSKTWMEILSQIEKGGEGFLKAVVCFAP